MFHEKTREHKEQNTSPVVSINTIKFCSKRLSLILTVCVLLFSIGAYAHAIYILLLSFLIQFAIASDRFLLSRYHWYRIWISSIYLAFLVAGVLDWLMNTSLWAAPAFTYSVFIAEHLFTKQLAALKAEHHIPQEIED